MKNIWLVALALWSLDTSLALADTAATAPTAPVIYKVGQVTRHAQKFEGKQLQIQGYRLAPGTDYVLVSDEPSGAIGSHDLPVTGPGIAGMKANVKYLLVGTFIKGGLVASNGNPDHFELATAPTEKPK